jgi:hypothetical protein
MPPATLWLQGPDDIVAFLAGKVWSRGRVQLVSSAMMLMVLGLEGGAVAACHSFMAASPRFDPARYGLAATLPS